MISKKDLLKRMQISYGQLYRWKREGLIPDDWFVKQSAVTGQETVFKEELIIPRIQTILELKDKYQLEEMKQYLDPDIKEKKFTIREVLTIEEIDPFLAREYYDHKQHLSIYDVILLAVFSIHKNMLKFEDALSIDTSLLGMDMVFYIVRAGNNPFWIIAGAGSILDPRLEILHTIMFVEVSQKIALMR